MNSNYNNCLQRVLKDEGGYTNNPNDSGGPTNYGITLTDYRKYINKSGTASDVKKMSVDDAKSIYKSKYWDALDCDSLSGGVDYTVFDYGINSGLGRPQKAIQKFKGKTGADLINAINDERTVFLKALGRGKDAVFLKGWMARVSRVRAYSLSLAKDNSTGPVTGGGVLGIGATMAAYWHSHETAIILSAVAAAIAVGTAIHIYKNRK